MTTTIDPTIKEYNFEIYTKHPETGKTGWDIKFASVFAASKDEAKVLLKDYPHFDCIILFNFGGAELGIPEKELYNSGVKYFDRHSYMNNDIVAIYR